MTPTLLRRLMLSCTATIVLAGAAPAAFAEDRALPAGDRLHRHDHVPQGRDAGAGLRRVEERRDGACRLGEIRDGSGIEPTKTSIFRLASVSKVFAAPPSARWCSTDGRAQRPAAGPSRPRHDGADQRRPHAPPHRPRHPDLRPAVGRAARGLAAGGPFATNTEAAQLAAIEDGDPFLFAPGTPAVQRISASTCSASRHPCRRQALCRRAPRGGARPARHGRHHDNPPAGARTRLMQGHGFDGSPLPAVRARPASPAATVSIHRRRHAPLHRLERR